MNRFAAETCTVQQEGAAVASLASRSSGTPHHVNLQDRSGKTLLMHNCAKGLASTVEELSYDVNIDVNLSDNEGNTALHHAAQAGHSGVLQVLLERFSDLQIDQLNKLGQTALIKTAIQGRVKCAKLLLDSGADPYLRDFGRQFCALEWAEYVGRTECAHMIAHFMLDATPSQMSATTEYSAEIETLKPRHSSRRRSPAAHTKEPHYHRIMPKKKFSDTASNNFKQVACLAAIPLIGGAVSGELPAVVRPRVRSAPPIPTFKITTPQQTLSQLKQSAGGGRNSSGRSSRTSNSKGSKSPRSSGAYRGAPLMAAVVAHCRVRPSSSCA